MRKPRYNFAYVLSAPKPKRKQSPLFTTRPDHYQLRIANNCSTPWRDAGTHPLLDTPAAVVPPHECRRRVWSTLTATGERVKREWRS